MNLDLDAAQLDLQRGILEFCMGRVPLSRVRKAAESGGVDRHLFGELADAGVFSMRLPTTDGGLQLGFADAVVVYEQLGRFLVPGPVVAQHLAAGLVPGAADATTLVGSAEAGCRVLTYPGAVDVRVVIADRLTSVAEVDLPTVRPAPRPLDPVTPVAVPAAPVLGQQPLTDAPSPSQWQVASDLLHTALLVGNATATTDLAVAYAKQREQFGRPIGTFQAIKHLCADALSHTEVARAAVYAAACHLDDPQQNSAATAVSTAAVLAAGAAHRNAKICMQVHAGLGFTWEADVHLYLKRVRVWVAALGGLVRHEERVAAGLG